MKIDFHCHTKKTKKTEKESRNVSNEMFKEKIEASGVEIVAITNHNHFDKNQYLELKELVKTSCQVWPGIELDVLGTSNKQSHLILISNPSDVDAFDEVLSEIISDTEPDAFVIKLDELYNKVKDLDIIYVAHCFKDKELPFNDIEDFEKMLFNPKRLFREPSNLTSITVLQSNKYRVIVGTDVINWSKYEEYNFGELKFKVKDYNSFIKLIEKDIIFLTDIINEQLSEEIKVYGIANKKEYEFNLPIYNDINIIFGDKGSGKSEILKSLKTYYEIEKNDSPVYYESTNRDNWYLDLIKPDDEEYDIKKFNNTYDCSTEITDIKDFVDTNPVNIKKYKDYFKKKSNKVSKEKMKILNINKTNLYNETKYRELYNEHESIATFINTTKSYKTKLNEKEQSLLDSLLMKLYKKTFEEACEMWKQQKSEYLFEDFVGIMPEYVSRYTGEPVKPVETGFFTFAKARFDLLRNTNKVLTTLQNNIGEENVYIGDLSEKGKVHLQSDYILMNYNNKDEISSTFKGNDSKYILSSSNKGNLDLFIVELLKIKKNYNDNALNIVTIKDLYNNKNITSLSEFIAIRKSFQIGTSPYVPSSGEKSILSLQHDFLSKTNKNVFLIDEPELGLGSTYINTTIIPLFKNLAKSKKIVVIATHDANIAVRTRPLNSILKLTHNNNYKTYIGNMFTDSLTNITDENDSLSWRELSVKYLEGGDAAFEERGELYE